MSAHVSKRVAAVEIGSLFDMRRSAARARATQSAQPMAWIKRAMTVRKERAALADLSAEQLRDIGVTREAAQEEAARPLWDLPSDR